MGRMRSKSRVYLEGNRSQLLPKSVRGSWVGVRPTGPTWAITPHMVNRTSLVPHANRTRGQQDKPGATDRQVEQHKP